MELIDFPLTGNLRPGDVLRTVYLDRDVCALRNMKSAEGRNLFELALSDYEPGCKQELWDTEGSGAFVHRDWKDGVTLPNLVVHQDEDTGAKRFLLASQDGTRLEALEDGRQHAIFNKLWKSSHYMPMSREGYIAWLQDYKIWFKS